MTKLSHILEVIRARKWIVDISGIRERERSLENLLGRKDYERNERSARVQERSPIMSSSAVDSPVGPRMNNL